MSSSLCVPYTLISFNDVCSWPIHSYNDLVILTAPTSRWPGLPHNDLMSHGQILQFRVPMELLFAFFPPLALFPFSFFLFFFCWMAHDSLLQITRKNCCITRQWLWTINSGWDGDWHIICWIKEQKVATYFTKLSITSKCTLSYFYAYYNLLFSLFLALCCSWSSTEYKSLLVDVSIIPNSYCMTSDIFIII